MRRASSTRTRIFILFLSFALLAACMECKSGDDDSPSPNSDVIDDDSGGEASGGSRASDVPLCSLDCAGRECGSDGCGGLCGECSPGLACDEVPGVCVREAVALVPMRDGARLRTKVFLPDDAGSDGVPVLLFRTPYRYAAVNFVFENDALFHAGRGYAYVLQDVRGRGGSEGAFEPYKNEITDGADTIDWILSQPWSSGKIGVIGGSYDGYTAVAAAIGRKNIQVVVTEEVPEDERFNLAGGTPALGYLYWRRQLDTMFEPVSWKKDAASNALDIAGLDQTLLGYREPYWESYVAAETPDDPWWDGLTLRGLYASTCAPMLSVQSSTSKWDDPIRAWRGFAEDGCAEHRGDARLLVTPQDHVYHIRRIAWESTPANLLMLRFIDKWLMGKEDGLSDVPRVQFIADGESAFHSAENWPPPATELVLFLDGPGLDPGEGTLSADMPLASGQDDLGIDPETMDPCRNYPEAVYKSAPLPADVYIAGAPSVRLYFSAATPDADVFVGIYDRGPLSYQEKVGADASLRARWRNGFETAEPLIPGEVVSAEWEFFPIVHKFESGHSIIVRVTGGMCDHAENPNTGEPLGGQTHWSPTTLSIRRGAAYPSAITLPVFEQRN